MKKIKLVRPDDMIDVKTKIPDIVIDVKYYTGDNFVGERIDGYESPTVYLTVPAVEALAKVQAQLAAEGYGLKIFDGYRPRRAVKHFIRWSKKEEDSRTKKSYYPTMTRREIIEKGFICVESAHTRGSTVDLTVINIKTGEELDMGGTFDYFSESSFSDYDHLTLEQSKNRMLLRYLMRSEGFEPLQTEWWHFTLINEPYPNACFDFTVIDA